MSALNLMYFYWHLAVFPTAAFAITMLVTTLFGDVACVMPLTRP